MAGLQQFVGSWQETEKEGFEEMATALGKSNLSFFKSKTFSLLFAQQVKSASFETLY